MRRTALLSCLILLAACAVRAAADDVEVLDFADESVLQQAANTSYATSYDVIRNESYLVQLVERKPGTKSPPYKHRGSFFSLALNDGTVVGNRHPGGDGVGQIHQGRMELESAPSGGSGALLSSKKPLRRLLIFTPPFEDEPATEADLKANAERGRAEKKLGPDDPRSSGRQNYRVFLKQAKLDAKGYAGVPFFTHNEGRDGIRPSLMVMDKPHAWAGSKVQEVLWIPVEGAAQVAFGEQTAVLDTKKLMRIPLGYESKVTVTPKGKRFVAIVVGVGAKTP